MRIVETIKFANQIGRAFIAWGRGDDIGRLRPFNRHLGTQMP